MQRTILCLISILFAFSCSKQATWDYSEDANGNGILLISYKNMSNNTDNGFDTYHKIVYNKDGQIDSVERYEDGNILFVWDQNDLPINQTYSKSYYRNGNLEYEGINIDGKKNGVWKHYSRDGHILTSRTFIDGVPNGYWIDYDNHGHIKGITCKGLEFDSGKMIEYHSNGNKLVDISISDGRFYGKYTVFYHERINSGKVNIEGSYSNGKKDGRWVWYSPDGQIIKYESYANGFKSGKWTSFFEGTELVRFQGQYLDDRRQGLWEWYDKDSNLITSIQY